MRRFCDGEAQSETPGDYGGAPKHKDIFISLLTLLRVIGIVPYSPAGATRRATLPEAS